jgi:hypothetical protein
LLVWYYSYVSGLLLCLRTLFWNRGTHDIMVAVSVMSEGLLQVVDFYIQAVIITYGLGPLNEND